LTAEAEIGQKYLGTVSRIVDFGAFVEVFPGTDGLCISEIADHRVKDVRDELKEGQQILVKCIGKEGNKIKLSRRAVLRDENRRRRLPERPAKQNKSPGKGSERARVQATIRTRFALSLLDAPICVYFLTGRQ
jgi:polyribonucleotide nucleotidyltransferase